jgi:leucyl-tRNA synthetase
MPGYAGSSWYFLRYMDPFNEKAFADCEATGYWGQVDLYVGGTEHAVGHLLYSRMWTKVLFDLGYIGHEEPYKKLLNQGKIGGKSYLLYFSFVKDTDTKQYEFKFINHKDTDKYSKNIHRKQAGEFKNPIIGVDSVRIPNAFVNAENQLTESRLKALLDPAVSSYYIQRIKKIELDVDDLINLEKEVDWQSDEKNGQQYVELFEFVEKMSKSKGNVVSPDEIIEKFGADTFRIYEMFLGPIEQDKPWDTKGIEGVHRFLRKLWRLFYDETKGQVWTDEKAAADELKILHRTIRKIEEDTEKFSFNTAVSAFMVCVNDLGELKCHKKEILEKLLVLLTPYAPHISEELWHRLGKEGSVLDAAYPVFEERYVAETSKEYPVSINGKVRANIEISLDASASDVEELVLNNETVQKWLAGKPHKKIIYVKGRMVNVVM